MNAKIAGMKIKNKFTMRKQHIYIIIYTFLIFCFSSINATSYNVYLKHNDSLIRQDVVFIFENSNSKIDTVLLNPQLLKSVNKKSTKIIVEKPTKKDKEIAEKEKIKEDTKKNTIEYFLRTAFNCFSFLLSIIVFGIMLSIFVKIFGFFMLKSIN